MRQKTCNFNVLFGSSTRDRYAQRIYRRTFRECQFAQFADNLHSLRIRVGWTLNIYQVLPAPKTSCVQISVKSDSQNLSRTHYWITEFQRKNEIQYKHWSTKLYLTCFTKTHLISQDTTMTCIETTDQPVHSFQLIWPKLNICTNKHNLTQVHKDTTSQNINHFIEPSTADKHAWKNKTQQHTSDCTVTQNKTVHFCFC